MNVDRQDKIERYLLNKMSESEKAAFQFALLQDKELRAETEALRRIQKTVSAQKKRDITRSENKSKPWWLLLLLLLPLGYFLLPSANEKKLSNLPVPTKTETPPAILPADTLTTEKPQPPDTVKKIEQEPLKDFMPEKKKDKKEPIALANPADLLPNPLFEQMMSGVRGNQITLSPQSPRPDAVVSLQQGKFTLNFNGLIETDNPEHPRLHLLIFGNKKADFEDWNYLSQTRLQITEAENALQYFTRLTLDVQPGLYYYVIEDEETEQPVLTGRFTVR